MKLKGIFVLGVFVNPSLATGVVVDVCHQIPSNLASFKSGVKSLTFLGLENVSEFMQSEAFKLIY